MDAKDRVYAAADELVAESGSTPTVALVRERAGCSNADATRYLRQWRTERAEQAMTEASVPAIPGSVDQALKRSATTLWSAAVQAARAEHDAAVAAARASADESRAEADSLAAQADEAESALHLAREETVRLTRVLEEVRAELDAARADAARAAQDAAEQLRAATEDARAARDAAAQAESARALAEGQVVGMREALHHLPDAGR